MLTTAPMLHDSSNTRTRCRFQSAPSYDSRTFGDQALMTREMGAKTCSCSGSSRHLPSTSSTSMAPGLRQERLYGGASLQEPQASRTLGTCPKGESVYTAAGLCGSRICPSSTISDCDESLASISQKTCQKPVFCTVAEPQGSSEGYKGRWRLRRVQGGGPALVLHASFNLCPRLRLDVFRSRVKPCLFKGLSRLALKDGLQHSFFMSADAEVQLNGLRSFTERGSERTQGARSAQRGLHPSVNAVTLEGTHSSWYDGVTQTMWQLEVFNQLQHSQPDKVARCRQRPTRGPSPHGQTEVVHDVAVHYPEMFLLGRPVGIGAVGALGVWAVLGASGLPLASGLAVSFATERVLSWGRGLLGSVRWGWLYPGFGSGTSRTHLDHTKCQFLTDPATTASSRVAGSRRIEFPAPRNNF